jgi:hypothetical protein
MIVTVRAGGRIVTERRVPGKELHRSMSITDRPPVGAGRPVAGRDGGRDVRPLREERANRTGSGRTAPGAHPAALASGPVDASGRTPMDTQVSGPVRSRR